MPLYLLKKEVAKQIADDFPIRKKIAKMLSVDEKTVMRWSKKNDITLTAYSVLKTIERDYKIPLKKLIENVKK